MSVFASVYATHDLTQSFPLVLLEGRCDHGGLGSGAPVVQREGAGSLGALWGFPFVYRAPCDLALSSRAFAAEVVVVPLAWVDSSYH